jgi:hypothetical protein
VNLVAELWELVIGEASEHEPNVSLLQLFGNIGNALRKKRIVPQVRAWVKGNRSKENHNRLAKFVADFNGDIERWIVERTLRTLHPVHNASAVKIWRSGAAHRHPRIRQ